MQVDEMFVESKICPLGVDALWPAFAWSFTDSSERMQMQTAYRIIVSRDESNLKRNFGEIWDSGKIFSKKNVHILYKGSSLQSRARYYWKVQIWDQKKRMTESPVSWWEMGLVHESDWSAMWIGESESISGERTAMPLFRHAFNLNKPIASARAYVSGLGHYELRINGKKVGDSVLEPGWTHYDKTCLYCVHDVTEVLNEGPNAIGVMLGNGFFHVAGGRYTKFKHSFGTPRCLIQLEVTFTDGDYIQIGSGRNWHTAPGPITFSSIYGGEDYDSRRLQADWDQPRFAPNEQWKQAVEVKRPAGKLKAQAITPLKVMETFQPAHITQPVPGVYVVDFGQNFSGWVEICAKGRSGSQITLSPAEVVKDTGTVNQKWTGSPYKFTFILNGDDEEETWAPRFSYYGFRYLQIEGAIFPDSASSDTDIPVLLRVEGQMIYPDTKVRGNFLSSDLMLNRTHDLINRAILSNMKSIFTDCPHREKLGWLEQVHLMGPSVAFNYDAESLFIKTMEDIRDAQLPDGMVPTTAPEYVVFSDQWRCFRDSVSWGAAYVLVGWNLLHTYGNSRILTEHYEGMKAYIDYLTNSSDRLIIQTGLGDWYDVGDSTPGFVQNTPVSHTETAMFYHIVDVFAQIASLLNYSEDAVKYGLLREDIKSSFNETFFDLETHQYATGSQTSNAMPLVLGLVQEPFREKVLSHLIKDIHLRGYHTTAGDIGHRYVLLALAQNGRSDIIFEMTRQTGHPSYGYQLAHGATTLTEAWDGPTVGKSQNHFMLGHLEEWLYSGLAGIQFRYDTDFESYQISIQPALPAGLDEVTAEYLLLAGRIHVSWKRSGPNRLNLRVTIPANCVADIYVPTASVNSVLESGEPIETARNLEVLRTQSGYVAVHAGSGTYHFESIV
ncbi:family 78 glycoside hydrolase catalytic domain [Paenibacillus hexagrammi]|uniref:alpha-L-rhamnosidase n=1 Tax=Paenibacillus hexagrammi TaxID=2908839 RepID=A0ABY3SPK4_9BACL|nr:family 78 glycoside hydrolase catalytic domain [Paenibacillus sp. YPD9-1]UJF35629.1 glycoside hydrolase family 78 protein [Paenibacillus sp. YPD9-1]